MTERHALGSWKGVSLEVAAMDGVTADVDLSFACMFSHELGDDGPHGGLLHLDKALSGALVRLRGEGAFRGELMETLLFNHLPAGITARAVMVIGVGDPSVWSPEVTARAAAAAVRAAVQLGVASAAFAPSMLDGGLTAAPTSGAAPAMMKAVVGAIDAQARVAASGLAPASSLRRWAFDAGQAHLEAATKQYQTGLVEL